MIPISKPFLTKEEAEAASKVIESGWITQGPKVLEFEQKFAEYTGSKFAVATSSCTTALHLALKVAGITSGDEVICPSMSFIATANSIMYLGAVPVFADVNPFTYNIDIIDTERKITAKTKAILIVHQIGIPADIDAFKSLCAKYNLLLIEDAACAIGSEYKGQKIGSHSDLVCFSFHPRKVITTGDGGMITTSREDYYNRLKLLRQHGMSVSDLARHASDKVIIEEYLEVGYNYRMTDIQASIGIKQLEKLDYIIAERRKIAAEYDKAFKTIDCIQLPVIGTDDIWNIQSYIMFLKNNCPVKRNDLMQILQDRGVSSRRGIMNAHTEKAYTTIFGNQTLPNSESLSDNCIILPLFVGMTDNDIMQVINAIKSLLS